MLEKITAEGVNLYSYITSPVENIPVTVTPTEVDDLVPTEDEIDEAIKKLRRKGGGGNWEKLVDLLQTAFWEGEMAEEATWQTVILIPKARKEYRGIGIVEVMWKVVAAILHRRITASITYHDFLHGFRAGSSLVSRVAVPVPQPARNPCRKSW